MHTYKVWIKNSVGAPMLVTVQAENTFRALELAKALYGPNLISENVMTVD